MKTVTNNAFWREILDHLSGIILVFRIDEEEKTHLIFANKELKAGLGYQPEEFVLASETDGLIKQELEYLIDKIADLSHKKDIDRNVVCNFTAIDGRREPFFFDFKIFQTRSAHTNLIVTTLQPVQNNIPAAVSLSNFSDKQVATQDLFVAESDIMKAVMSKVNQIKNQHTNVLIRGEEGTGRHTIANRLTADSENRNAEVHYLDLENLSKNEQKLLLFGGEQILSDHNVQRYSGILENNRNIIIVLSEITLLSKESQQLLLQYLHAREKERLLTRIIGLTKYSLEEVMDVDEFDPTLYYELNFYPLLIPPLRQRKMDIPVVAQKWLKQIKKVLKMDELKISDRELGKLKNHNWQGNFPELFEILRKSLLSSDGITLTINLENDIKTVNQQNTKKNGVTSDEILTFDDMNRLYLKRVLDFTNGKIYGDDGAAALLDLKPTTLQSKLKKLGLK